MTLICDKHLRGNAFRDDPVHSAEHGGVRWTWTDWEAGEWREEPPTEAQQEDERAHCLNCAEAGDPDARRVHPAAECPWRPETFASRPSADTETLRQVREAAWFDGYQACRRGDHPDNPYHASRAALDGER